MANTFQEIVDLVHARLADAELPYGVLRVAQDEHGDVRRVVWIPISFTQSAPSTSGPVMCTDGVRRKQICTEDWLVECHIVGNDLEDTEAIRARIVWAMRTVMHADSRPTGGLWVTQAIDGASLTFGGLEKIIQRFELRVPLFVPDAAAGSRATIKHIETTPIFELAPETVVLGAGDVTLGGEPVVIAHQTVETAFDIDAPET